MLGLAKLECQKEQETVAGNNGIPFTPVYTQGQEAASRFNPLTTTPKKEPGLKFKFKIKKCYLMKGGKRGN